MSVIKKLYDIELAKLFDRQRGRWTEDERFERVASLPEKPKRQTPDSGCQLEITFNTPS